MKITGLLGTGRPLYSFEFFPPKTDEGTRRLEETVAELSNLKPAYVSVTYGAGGSTRDRTIDLVGRIQGNLGITAMAHLTCVGAGRDEIARVLDRLLQAGISNIIALRGDPPAGAERFETPPGGFANASELVAFIRQLHGDAFCLAAAAYPETHVECRDPQRDMAHLKTKVDAGVDFLITQLFFDNAVYFDFVTRAKESGISVPIIAGIMPILNAAQIERFTRMCGASIPSSLQNELNRVREDAAAVEALGIAHATTQCEGLIAGGAPGVHFYTLNRSTATRHILENLRRPGLQ